MEASAQQESNVVPDPGIELQRGRWSRRKRTVEPKVIRRVFSECRYRCVVCGVSTTSEFPRDKHGRILAFNPETHERIPARFLTVDHIVPKCLGSANHYHNLMILCSHCNNDKAALLPRDWLRTLSIDLQILLIDRVIAAEMYHILVSEGDPTAHRLHRSGQRQRNRQRGILVGGSIEI